MNSLVVLCAVIAAASANGLGWGGWGGAWGGVGSPWAAGVGAGWGGRWGGVGAPWGGVASAWGGHGAGAIGPVTSAVAAPLAPGLNYRGPVSLHPGQPANVIAQDGRPLDTLSVNLDRAAHLTARAVDSANAHLLHKRSVAAAWGPAAAWGHAALPVARVAHVAPVVAPVASVVPVAPAAHWGGHWGGVW